LIRRLRHALADRERIALSDGSAKKAAVLVALVQRGDDIDLLCFLRTANVFEHKSEICFPGGSLEADDDGAVGAALREAREELGIDPGDVDVLGLLDDVATHVSGYSVTPVVGYIRAMPNLVPDQLEVELPIVVPLRHLMDPGSESAEFSECGGVTRLRYSYAFGGRRIWGATGRIIRNLLDVLLAVAAQGMES